MKKAHLRFQMAECFMSFHACVRILGPSNYESMVLLFW